MEVFHTLSTERLAFSVPEARDIPRLLEYAKDPVISRNLLTFPYPYTEKDAIWWINSANEGHQSGDAYIFAFRDKETESFMGGIGLHLDKMNNLAEVGYWLGEPHRGKGYATEGTKEMIRFGFETLGLNKITSSHYEYNPGSGKVIVKSGLIKEGVRMEQIKKEDGYHHLHVYGLTRAQYEVQKSGN